MENNNQESLATQPAEAQPEGSLVTDAVMEDVKKAFVTHLSRFSQQAQNMSKKQLIRSIINGINDGVSDLKLKNKNDLQEVNAIQHIRQALDLRTIIQAKLYKEGDSNNGQKMD